MYVEGGVTVTSTVRVEFAGTVTSDEEKETFVSRPATAWGNWFGPHVPTASVSDDSL